MATEYYRTNEIYPALKMRSIIKFVKTFMKDDQDVLLLLPERSDKEPAKVKDGKKYQELNENGVVLCDVDKNGTYTPVAFYSSSQNASEEEQNEYSVGVYDNDVDDGLEDTTDFITINKTGEVLEVFKGEEVDSSYGKMRRNYLRSANSYGWEVDESEVDEALDLYIEIMGKERAFEDIVETMSTNELAESLAYLFRMNEIYEWDERRSIKSRRRAR